MTADRRHPDADGFTLPEVLIVVVILGLIVASLAAAFVAVIRTNPASEARVDDSRALLNLTNWISQDVSSTDESGFAVGNSPSGCGGVPSSAGLMELRWTQSGKTYVSNYRYVATGASTGRIHRFTCVLGGTASDLEVTPDLNNIGSGPLTPAPVTITLVPNGSGGNKGLQFVVTVLDDNGVQRELLSHDATTSNVHSTLPPLGGGGGSSNHAPEALRGTTSVAVGGSVDYSLPVSDSDGDLLSTSFPPLSIPTGWNITAIGTLVTITPDPDVIPGTYTFEYVVKDPTNATASNFVDVIVSAFEGNQPPTAGAVMITASRSVPVTVSLPANDAEDGTNLAVSLSNVPASLSTSLSGLDLTVTPSSTAGGSYSFNYTVTDTGGATATSTVTVRVCSVSSMSIATPVDVHTSGQNAGNLKQDVDVTIVTNGYCGGALVLAFRPKATDAVETTLQFGTNTAVTILKAAFVWDIATRDVTLNVRQGANGTIERSGTLRVNA